MTQKRREAIVGIVFVGALVILGFFTVVIGKYNPLEPPKKLWVYFPSVGGLREGNVVRIAGLEIGQVKRMKLMPKGVLARLEVQPGVRLHEGYEIKVRSFSPLGGKYVDVDRGDLTKPEVETDFVDPEKNYTEVLRGGVEAELISELSDLAEKAKPVVLDAVKNLRDATAKINEMQGTIGKLIGDPTIHDNLARATERLDEAVEHATEIVRKIDRGEGTLARLVNDPKLYEVTTGTLERVQSIAKKVDEGEGAVGALFNDEKLRQKLVESAEHLESILAGVERGEGNVGRLFRDTKLYDNLAGALEDLGKTLRTIAEAKGPLGVLFRDEKAGEDLKATIAHMERVTGALADGRGTLGKLIMDDRLIREAERVFVEIRESTEDLREQAPINAFATAILQGAF
jgi:phospholipid/cholesterol/gamma-HCH transport system substrate-binding protein